MAKVKYLFLFFLYIVTSTSVAQYTVINKGVGGDNSTDLLCRLDNDVLKERPDLVIMLVGGNDMLNSNKLVSYSQFEENLQTLIYKITSQKIHLVLMSPTPVDTDYLLKRHDPKLFTEDLNRMIDSAGSIVKKLAHLKSLGFVDLNVAFKAHGSPNRSINSLTINQVNSEIEDGIHPTKEGYTLIAKSVYSHLATKGLLKKNQKIICFGDSFTFGSYMEGAGTAEGDTYPAQLLTLLEAN